LLFGEPITRFISNHIVQLFELRKKAQVVGGEVIKVSAFIVNRNVTSLVLGSSPLLLFMGALATVRRRRVGLVVLIVATATCSAFAERHLCRCLFWRGSVLSLAAVSLKATRALLAGGWVIATLLAVPLGAVP
jgi:hypothetical protein